MGLANKFERIKIARVFSGEMRRRAARGGMQDGALQSQRIGRQEMGLQQTGIGVRVLAGCALLAMGGLCAYAQTQGTEQKAGQVDRRNEPTETIFLHHVTGPADLNDVQTALRNAFPWSKMYGVSTQDAIVVKATTEEMQGIKKMIAELDRPRKVYRVTYNLYDVENGNRTGAQHYSLNVTSGSKTVLKHGKRVPLVTGMYGDNAAAAQNSQVQYIDVGINIEANVEGVALHTKLEVSGVADEKSGIGVQDPVIQQTMLEGTATLGAGKPVMLGSIDIPGTTRHEDIEVTTEALTQ